ncbi:MAG TPA: hypothetical protein VK066_31385 [Chloroflexota bacterium]|nr:hypothetical protein [Chloroflexota bacterium]
MAVLECAQCGAPIADRDAMVARDTQQFCSAGCADMARTAGGPALRQSSDDDKARLAARPTLD